MPSIAPAFAPRRLRESFAAFYLGVSPSTFRRKVEKGEYPPGKREDGMVFWLRDELDRLIEKQFGLQISAASEQPIDELALKLGAI